MERATYDLISSLCRVALAAQSRHADSQDIYEFATANTGCTIPSAEERVLDWVDRQPEQHFIHSIVDVLEKVRRVVGLDSLTINKIEKALPPLRKLAKREPVAWMNRERAGGPPKFGLERTSPFATPLYSLENLE